MENRIRRVSSWDRKEKKVGHGLIPRLINTIRNTDTRDETMAEMRSTANIAQQSRATLVPIAERDRILSTVPISMLGRMLQ